MKIGIFYLLLLLPVLLYSANKIDSNNILVISNKAEDMMMSNHDSAAYYFDLGLKLCKSKGDIQNEINLLLNYSRYNSTKGHYEVAFKNCKDANKLSEEYGITKYDFEIKMYTGLVYYNMGLYLEGLELLIDAQKLYLPKSTSYYKKAELDYYTGMAYIDIGDLNNGLNYLNSSISISLLNNDSLSAYKSYSLFTLVFQNPDTLNKYFDICENILKKHPELDYQKVVLNVNKAMNYIDQGNLKESRTLYIEGIHLCEKRGFDEYQVYLYNNFAYQLMYEKSYDSVIYYLDKASRIAFEIKNLAAQAETYDSYSDYYTKIGDYKNALKYSKLYIEKSNEFREQQKMKETRFLSAVFENEKKENAILKQQNEINKLWLYFIITIAFLLIVVGMTVYFRQRWALSRSKLETSEKIKKLEIAEAKIQGQDAERDRLGMDLHDGVVADLSLLKMKIQSSFKENSEFNSINHILKSIIQNLRGLSHRMRPASLEEFGLIPSIQNLTHTINQSGRFKVEFNCDFDERFAQNIEVSIYFLIYELVNNATKYSKGDTVDIQLYKDKDVINLSVEDNGGGFAPNNIKKGQGLKNINERLSQLGGEMIIDSHDDATAFIIKIPLKND